MLVDSSGSRKPLDKPMATTFFFHTSSRWPGLNRMARGWRITSPFTLASSAALASSSLTFLLL